MAEQLYRWAACSLFCDDERIRWAVLVVSEIRGSGKSLCATILQALHYGPFTASLETLGALTGKFNGWLAGKTMVVCHETIDASQSSFTAMEALKSSITEEVTMVEAKGRDKTQCRAWARYWFCSNSLFGLPYDANERRIFAVVCNATEPREPEFYTAIGSTCLAGEGLRDIAAMLRPYADVPLALRAPPSDTALIQDSLIPPFVDILNEAAGDQPGIALRGKDMNDIVRHITGQSLRGGGQAEQLRRGGWRQVRTTVDGASTRGFGSEAKFRIKSMTRCAAESWTVTRRGWCDGRGGRRKASKNAHKASHASQKVHRFQPMLAGLQYLFVTL